MKKRNPLSVILLSFITLGLYGLYWFYQTNVELKRESGRADIRPGLDLLLTMLTFGIYGVWVAYRNSKLASEMLTERQVEHENRAWLVAGLGALSYFTSWTTWVAVIALLQLEYNALAEPVDYFATARPFENNRATTDGFGTEGSTTERVETDRPRVEPFSEPIAARVAVNEPARVRVEPVDPGREANRPRPHVVEEEVAGRTESFYSRAPAPFVR